MSIAAVDPQPAEAAETLARALTAARRAAAALPGFPGPIPDALSVSYAVQEAAIGLWGDEIVGWKVGRVPDAWQAKLDADRLAGPIFRRNLVGNLLLHGAFMHDCAIAANGVDWRAYCGASLV